MYRNIGKETLKVINSRSSKALWMFISHDGNVSQSSLFLSEVLHHLLGQRSSRKLNNAILDHRDEVFGLGLVIYYGFFAIATCLCVV